MGSDFERALAVGRDLGQESIEVCVRYNLGEYLYLWGDMEAAAPHVESPLVLFVAM